MHFSVTRIHGSGSGSVALGPGLPGPDMKFFQINLQQFDKKVLCPLEVSEHSLSISSTEKWTFLRLPFVGTTKFLQVNMKFFYVKIKDFSTFQMICILLFL
jgi:hypothetical protein